MKTLYIKQKVLSFTDKFTVTNAGGDDVYFVQGSFLKIPKSFTITDHARNEVAYITKKVWSWLPKFFVEVDGREVLVIKKNLTFFRSRYTVEGSGLEVSGNWWDMDFTVEKDGECVGSVHKKWFKIGDHYEINIHDEAYEKVIVAIVVAIDRVLFEESASSTMASL